MSESGERAPRLEGELRFLPAADFPDSDFPADSLLQPARDLLMRELEYEGLIPEGASYSIEPLAVFRLKA